MYYEDCEELNCFMHGLIKRNPGELEFHQAVREVAESLFPFLLEHRKYRDAYILERMTEQKIALAMQSNPLSGLPGNNMIKAEIERRLSTDHPFAVFYFDLDNFKFVSREQGSLHVIYS